MTLQEILKAKGLDDKAIEGIIGEMKQNKIFTSAEENLDIRYGKLKTDFDALTKQHGESTALIEQMKKDFFKGCRSEGLTKEQTEILVKQNRETQNRPT